MDSIEMRKKNNELTISRVRSLADKYTGADKLAVLTIIDANYMKALSKGLTDIEAAEAALNGLLRSLETMIG